MIHYGSREVQVHYAQPWELQDCGWQDYHMARARGEIKETYPQNEPVEQRVEKNGWFKHPVEDVANSSVFLRQQTMNPDNIFGRGQYACSVESYPDHKQYIFHTSGHGNMQVMYPNNMVMPVRHNPDLYDVFLNRFETRDFGKENDGVYILDYFNIKTLPNNRAGLENFLSYYNTSGIVYNGNRNILTEITNAILEGRDAYIRVITFIPRESFAVYGAIFVRHAGLVVGYGLHALKYIHPYSEEAGYMAGKVSKDVTNYIEIDIIDNKSNDDYYTSIGGKCIVKLEPTKNPGKPDGASLNVYRNQDCILSKKCSIEELKDTLGIYKSKEEALYNGDIVKAKEQIIEERKIDTKVLTANLEYDKVLHSADLENKKFGNDILRETYKQESIRMESEKERLKHDLHAIQNVADLRHHIQKQNLDSAHSLEKFNMDIEKMRRERDISTIQIGSKLLNLIGGLF